MKMSRMYILVKNSVPRGKAINAVGHASLGCYLKFKDDPIWPEYLEKSFTKVTCLVTDEQFEQAKKYADHAIICERTLDNQEIAMAFVPRLEYPKFFKYLTLFK